VKEIVQYFNNILAELKNVKKTLNTRLFTNSGNSLSDISITNAKAAPKAELQYKAPSQRQGAEQVPLVIPENRHRESIASNTPEPVRSPSPALLLSQNIMTKEPPPQAYKVPINYKVLLTLSTSTEPLNRTTQLNKALLNL
jgi:hypothetical protein